MSIPPLQRITLSEPGLLRQASADLSSHGYTPWSFWLEDEICIQFHAERDADLGFLNQYREASNQEPDPASEPEQEAK